MGGPWSDTREFTSMPVCLPALFHRSFSLFFLHLERSIHPGLYYTLLPGAKEWQRSDSFCGVCRRPSVFLHFLSCTVWHTMIYLLSKRTCQLQQLLEHKFFVSGKRLHVMETRWPGKLCCIWSVWWVRFICVLPLSTSTCCSQQVDVRIKLLEFLTLFSRLFCCHRTVELIFAYVFFKTPAYYYAIDLR